MLYFTLFNVISNSVASFAWLATTKATHLHAARSYFNVKYRDFITYDNVTNIHLMQPIHYTGVVLNTEDVSLILLCPLTLTLCFRPPSYYQLSGFTSGDYFTCKEILE